MAAELSPRQKTALARLAEEYACWPNRWVSAYDIGQSLATLNALHTRGLCDKRTPLGSHAFPRSCIEYRFKPQAK